MSLIAQSVTIERPPEAVFDFASTAGHWPEWHPATESVTGAIDHPARVGEEILERIRVGPLRSTTRWTVERCERPGLWQIASEHPQRGIRSRIAYRCSSVTAGTRFERRLEYELGGIFRLLDALVLRRRNRRQSRRALANLKRRLEGEGAR